MGKDRDSTGRRLTHDELKAAEAAFQGQPFNEAWSQAARGSAGRWSASRTQLRERE